MDRETGYEVERELAAGLGAGLCEAVGVGAGFDDVAAEGEAVHGGYAEPGVGEGLGAAAEALVGGRLLSDYRDVDWPRSAAGGGRSPGAGLSAAGTFTSGRLVLAI